MNTTTVAVTNIDSLLTPNTGTISGPASFAEDAVGNHLHRRHSSGSVFRINTGPPLTGDYNADGTVDAADYTVWRDTLRAERDAAGSGADGDGNGIVDDARLQCLGEITLATSVHTSGPAAARPCRNRQPRRSSSRCSARVR